MKKIKIKNSLCLLLVTVCSIFFTVSLTAIPTNADGSTEVIARIETISPETSQPTANTDSYEPQDINNISTGDSLPVYVAISLLLFTISVLVIYFYGKKHKRSVSK